MIGHLASIGESCTLKGFSSQLTKIELSRNSLQKEAGVSEQDMHAQLQAGQRFVGRGAWLQDVSAIRRNGR